MIPRCKVGTGVTGAVRYALGEGNDPQTMKPRRQPANDRSRVEWIGGTGVGFPIETREDADLARRIMEFDALNQTSPTKRCVKDCVHLSLGWRPGEQPTREQMEAAAHDALKAIGMGNCKAVFVAHNDEHYAHLHIVASKLNPETERAYDLKESYLKLSRWAEQYEREHSGGIVCTRREEANRLRDAIKERDAGGVLELMTEQRSTFTGKDLERELSKQIKGELGRAQFAEAVLSHSNAVRLSDQAAGPTTRYSTRAVLETEQHVLRAAHGLARNDRHQVGERILASVVSDKTFDGISREQARAVRHATGAEGLALIDGQAGTGKSYTMAAIRQAYEAQGCKVIGLAPTNAVAQDMQRDGFARAGTVHSELFGLNNERTQWAKRTVVMVDEAAMIDTRNMAMLTAHAHAAGAKLILVGDDRQLSSIERGGMFGVLKDRYGAAELAEVRRQHKNDDRRAAELMAEGNFHDALVRYDDKGAIHWTRTQDQARAALVAQWAKDNAADPSKSRFVFAYTNADVSQLNRDIRQVRKEAGQLEQQDHGFGTKHGRAEFSAGDRVQFTGTDKPRGLYNGQAGTVQAIDGSKFTVRLDGRGNRAVEFDAKEFQDFRLGYAGTIYRGQGRTLDQTYLYHSEHWRSAAGYVALTRHRDKAELFVARNTAADVKHLARQMARVDDRRAASHFHQAGEHEPVRPLTPRELAARFNDPAMQRRYEREVQRREKEQSQSREADLATGNIAAHDARDFDHSSTAGKMGQGRERENRNARFTPSGEDRRPDGHGATQDRGRGGRGGRTR
jgi:Ti-type conjugative transfer relaxase TraA